MIPAVDAGVRQRLRHRFGGAVEAWFDQLPEVLTALSHRWQLELSSHIPRGSVSVVFRCRTARGEHAVLKISPDRARLAVEARALQAWSTRHTPAVLAVDDQLGALLIEAIEPGTPLDVSSISPDLESVADLLRDLHATGAPDTIYPTVSQRVAYLFESSAQIYERHPAMTALIPPELYERGRRLAMRLAQGESSRVLVHGDLTPRNILDGGEQRGLVAIDPAPCVGDGAFDAIDLILWQPDDRQTIEARIMQMAAATGGNGERLFTWCVAFATMSALELATDREPDHPCVPIFLELASEAPRF
jgi:streptomycin 6-kinase